MRVLVLNAGSSSLKVGVVDDAESRLQTDVEAGDTVMDAVRTQLEAAGIAWSSIAGVGHRIVHGGPRLTAPVVIDDGVLAQLDAVTELAPLHNAPALAIVRGARSALPGCVHVACFDTAMHRELPEATRRYPVPQAWHDDWGIRRYGFHGLSVQWACERAAVLLGRELGTLELVVAHLGSGASVTAVSRGVSVATSMGFTPLEGLMMGTRSGSIDPGALLHLLRTGRLDADAMAHALEHDSGLRGVSGTSSDVRELEAAAGDDERAALALEMFVDRAAQGIAAAAIALPRLDALVFTGGIGEHAGVLRARIVRRLAVLSVPTVGDDESGDDRVLAGGGDDGPAVLRIAAREDLVIARAVEQLA